MDSEPPRRLAAVVAIVAVPWVVVVSRGEITVIFAFGLVDPAPFHLTTVTDYLFRHTRGLPRFLLAWPVASLQYGIAVVAAAAATRGREDVRVTAGLLTLAGASLLWTAVGFARRPGYAAFPAGTAALWAVVWWYYWPTLRQVFAGTTRG